MRSLGIWLIIFAIGSVLLPRIGLQFIFVAWIDMWGPTIGWAIRGAMAVVGIGLIAGSMRTGGRAARMGDEPPGV